MRLNRPPPRTPPETIVALIDIVFFLLVFFMLIGRLDATAPFRLDPPIANSGEDLPGGGATLAMGSDGMVALDGRQIDRAAAIEALRSARESDPELRVRVNADGAAELRFVLPLLADLKRVGVHDVVLVVTPGRS